MGAASAGSATASKTVELALKGKHRDVRGQLFATGLLLMLLLSLALLVVLVVAVLARDTAHMETLVTLLSQEIAAGLARFRWFHVIAPVAYREGPPLSQAMGATPAKRETAFPEHAPSSGIPATNTAATMRPAE